MRKDCRESSVAVESWEVISWFVHAWGTKGTIPSYQEFSYIVSSVDIKRFIYWILISQFQINHIFNFLLGVCANDCLSILSALLIRSKNFM